MTGLKTNEREGTRAVLRHARIAPNKVREVLDLIRNKPVQEAEDILRFSERDAAFTVGKVLHSAIANAEANDEQNAEELYVASAYADEGTTIKRWRPRARGRATRIRKRTSHITVIVARLPEDKLERLMQRRRAEQLAQRARRVAGARKASGDTRSRAQRRRGEPIETPADEATEAATETAETNSALVAAEADEAGIVDGTADALAAEEAGEVTETAADTELAAEEAATEAGRIEAAEEEAGIVDVTAGAVAAEQAAEAAEAAATEKTENADKEEDGQ
ncbi:50S ribosomal protein L22 [Acidiferrimicrobium sp. IK]|uniref:50S ribosomal protein L22 n=1 Tax=Acidiferrimicrobium sp. IK TaxID=2871700 RepID=UPI003967231D|nr:50S ribosomal protein L22 [Acidiferrimicrobium sp. IK]